MSEQREHDGRGTSVLLALTEDMSETEVREAIGRCEVPRADFDRLVAAAVGAEYMRVADCGVEVRVASDPTRPRFSQRYRRAEGQAAVVLPGTQAPARPLMGEGGLLGGVVDAFAKLMYGETQGPDYSSANNHPRLSQDQKAALRAIKAGLQDFIITERSTYHAPLDRIWKGLCEAVGVFMDEDTDSLNDTAAARLLDVTRHLVSAAEGRN